MHAGRVERASATHLFPDEGQFEADDLLHLLLNLFQVTVGDGLWGVKVVEEAMLNPWPDGDLRSWEEPLDAHRHDM